MQKKIMIKLLFIFITIVVFSLTDCSRDRINPFDPNNPNFNATVLPAPTGLGIMPHYGWVTLKWDTVHYGISYQVYVNDEQIVVVDTNYCIINNLNGGEKYKFQVAGVDSNGLGGHKSDPIYAEPKVGVGYSKYEIYSDDNGDGIVNRGENIRMYIYLKNAGTDKTMGVTAVLSTNDTYISINSTFKEVFYYNLESNEEYKGNTIYEFSVSSNCPNGHIIIFSLKINDEDGNSWTDSFTITVQ